MESPNRDEVGARVRLLPTAALLLAAVLLVLGAPIAGVLVSRTAGDMSRMAMAGIGAEIFGTLASGIVINILKKARAQRSARSPTLALRSALAVARVTFWGSILLAAILFCTALFFLMMSFGLSG